jgi:hypothetical protein
MCLDVIKPDYGVVHAQALERLREGERAASAASASAASLARR